MKSIEPDSEMLNLKRPVVSTDTLPIFEVTDDQNQSRPVGLTDVDHTLDDTNSEDESIINMKLLNALKARGIWDICPFTDMMFLPHQIKHRLDLIKELKNQGFRVPAVITPNDFFWTSDPIMLDVLKRFDEALGRANIVFKENVKKNLDKLDGVLAEFPEIVARVNSLPKVGHAFKEASESYLRGEDISQLRERSYHCKTAIDVVSYLRGFASCKGIMCLQFLAHREEWVSACYVFDDNEVHIKAVNQCVSPNVPVFAIQGEFTIKRGDTFVANFAPYLVNATFSNNNPTHALAPVPAPISLVPSLEARMRDVVSVALMKIKVMQQEVAFGGLRYKKEFSQAENLFAKIIECGDAFERQWACVSAHFKNLPRSFSGAYQLSVFDIKILELLAADDMICNKVDALNNKKDTPVVFDMTQALDRQHFIRRLLGNPAPALEKGSHKKLHLSAGSLPKVQSDRISGPKAAFGFSKQKTASAEFPNQDLLRVITRERSQSDGPKPGARKLNASKEDSPTDLLELAELPDNFQYK